MTDDQYRNPLSRRTPLWGTTGVVIASLAPIVALVLFLLFGFAFGGWAWAWIFFVIGGAVSWIVYGVGGNNRQ